ncbi:hypothetical protein LEMLEM_LOCUS24382 [Lemmus lemmus]
MQGATQSARDRDMDTHTMQREKCLANQAEGHAQPYWADKRQQQVEHALFLDHRLCSEKVLCTKRYSHLGSGFDVP